MSNNDSGAELVQAGDEAEDLLFQTLTVAVELGTHVCRRTMKFRFSLEALEDLRAFHGLDAVDEMVTIILRDPETLKALREATAEVLQSSMGQTS